MARTQYTVTFPAAKAGDEVVWPNTVKVYPDANTTRPLGNGYIEVAAGSFTGWSDAASVTFTRAGTSDSVTVTTGSPTGTGAAVPSAASSATTQAQSVVLNEYNRADAGADVTAPFDFDPATDLVGATVWPTGWSWDSAAHALVVPLDLYLVTFGVDYGDGTLGTAKFAPNLLLSVAGGSAPAFYGPAVDAVEFSTSVSLFAWADSIKPDIFVIAVPSTTVHVQRYMTVARVAGLPNP